MLYPVTALAAAPETATLLSEAFQERLIWDDDIAVAVSPVGVDGAEPVVEAKPPTFSSAPPPPQPESPRIENRTANASSVDLDTTTPRLLLSSPFSLGRVLKGRI